jgi:hypothetical protein
LKRSFSAEEQDDFKKLPANRITSWMAVTDALVAGIGENSAGFANCPFVPEGALQIVVATRLVILPK